MRETTATRARCVRRGMGQTLPLSGRGSEMLPKMTHDPTYSSWTARGLLQTRSLSLSS